MIVVSLVLIAVAPSLVACTSSDPRNLGAPSLFSPRAGRPCTLSAKAVPSCGVLWGIATHPPTVGRVDAAERAIGRQVDFVYRYHDVNDVVPDAAERAWVAQGKLLHIAIAARNFNAQGADNVTWAQVAAGRYDASLMRQARGIASLHVPVFVTFEQEANQSHKLQTLGTPQDFIAAWRHVHDLYARAGASNAVWTWVMTGNATNLASAAKMWPGNRYVDWISWNVYNFSGCNESQGITRNQYVSFQQRMLIFYNWLASNHTALHIDINKPIMLSEVGSAQYPGDPQATANWYAGIPSVLKQYPQIKAIGLWDSTGACNFDFTNKPQIAAGVRRASSSPYLALHGALLHAR